MIYDFLKDFHRRIEIVAIVEFITTRVSRKMKFREFEFDSSEAINLVMLVLCFIMEKSLVEDTCTKNDITGFIRRLDIEHLKKGISDDEYVDIADYLIKDCLQNGGIPHYFKTYNFESGKEERINVKLIDDRRVAYEQETAYSYYMTPQGYRFMFNTLDIEDAMQVSIEQFKLNLSIKKRNFNAARNSVDGLFNISKTQLQRMNYFIKRVKGINHYYLDGTMTPEDRMMEIDNFNSDREAVFLISLKAGGTGLNLTKADIVIHFDPWWNPAVEDQASDRTHRMGQKNVVQVYKLLTEGTIEEKIVELQERKRDLIGRVLMLGESLLNKMNETEIKDMFGIG